MQAIIALGDITLDKSSNSYQKNTYYDPPTDYSQFALRIYLTNNKPIAEAKVNIRMLGQSPPSDIITIKSRESSELFYDLRVALTGRASQYLITLPTVTGKLGVIYAECGGVISNTVNFFAGIT